MARDLQGASLLAKIEGGYFIALEARCHLSCLVKRNLEWFQLV